MSEPDFSGIDPLRVPEARRRIATLEAYLALPSPTTADAVRAGAEIGLSRWQLQRLATVWRDHRDPGLIVVGRRGRSSRDYGVPPRANEIADEVIAASAPDASTTSIAVDIEVRCAAEDVDPPSRATIWSRAREARARSNASGPPRIVVGRMWFHLPVEGQPAGTMPTLLAAVLLPEGAIVAHRISTDALSPPPVADLVSEVAARRAIGALARELVIDDDDRRAAAEAVAAAGVAPSPARRRAPQKELSLALGGRLGRLAALYRRSMARPATRKAATRFERPLAPGAVVTAIEDAIAASNAAAGAMPAFDIA